MMAFTSSSATATTKGDSPIVQRAGPSCFAPLKPLYRALTATLPQEQLPAWRMVNIILRTLYTVLFIVAVALLHTNLYLSELYAPSLVSYLLEFTTPYVQLLFFWFCGDDAAELANGCTTCTLCPKPRVWLSRALSLGVPVAAFAAFYFVREFAYDPASSWSVFGGILRCMFIFVDFVNQAYLVLLLHHLREPYLRLRYHIETAGPLSYGAVYQLRKDCKTQFRCLNNLYSFVVLLALVNGVVRCELFVYMLDRRTRAFAYCEMAYFGALLVFAGEVNQHCSYDLAACRDLVASRKSANDSTFNLQDILSILDRGADNESSLTVWGIFALSRRFVICYLTLVFTVCVVYFGHKSPNLVVRW